MSKFLWTRKPDFRNISSYNYNEYWQERGIAINKKLKEREKIVYDIIPKGSNVFDIGCGNSRLPVELKEKGCDIQIADLSEVVLKEFSDHGIKGEKIDLEKINAWKSEKKFDYIILSEVLEHTKNPEEIIAKLKANTRFFLITIPNSAFYRYRWHIFFFGRFFTQWVSHPSEHLRFWSHLDFMDWLKAMDLKIIDSKASNGFSLFGLFPGLKNIWKNLFGHQIVYFCEVEKMNK